MELKILHFYPDLMSLYGSYANVSILKRTLEEMGNTVTVERVELGGDADLTHADFVYMGAGTERAQKAALLYFSKLGDATKDWDWRTSPPPRTKSGSWRTFTATRTSMRTQWWASSTAVRSLPAWRRRW